MFLYPIEYNVFIMTHETLKEKIIKALEKIPELEKQIADPQLPKEATKYKHVMQEHSKLTHLKEQMNAYEKICSALKQAEELKESGDEEITTLAEDEITQLIPQQECFLKKLKELVIPTDPLDEKNIIMEIRAGTGGEEASLFVSDLFRMYTRFFRKSTLEH